MNKSSVPLPVSLICKRVDYGYTASAKFNEIGPHFLRITDIVPERINWDSVPYCSIDPARINKYILNKGDIVIARTGATTGWAKYIKEERNSVFASYLVRIRIDSEKADPRFIGFIIESDNYKKYIQATMSGAA